MLAIAFLHSITTSGMPFTNSTMSGMMKPFTQPGVSMRNWLMAWKLVALGMLEVDQLDDRVCSPVSSLPSTCALKSSLWMASFASSRRAVRLAKDLIMQIVELPVGQPGRPSAVRLMRSNGLAEHLRQKPLAEAGAQALGRVGGNARAPGRSPSSRGRRVGRGTAFRRGGIQTSRWPSYLPRTRRGRDQ